MQSKQNSSDIEDLHDYWDIEQLDQEAVKDSNNDSNQPFIKTDQYPVPLPIIGEIKRVDFPINSLPPIIKDAVIAVERYVQAPTALIASCVLGVMSLVCQGVIKVRRNNA